MMAKRAFLRLAVIRSMMQTRGLEPNASSSNCILRTSTSHNANQSLWLQPCSSLSSDQGSSNIFNIQDSDDFKEKVLNAEIPTIVDFHASWCAPCKMLGPRLEEVVAATEGKVQLAKVDIDENTDLAIDYDVSSVPTVLAVKKGKITDQFLGLQEVHTLKLFVEKMY